MTRQIRRLTPLIAAAGLAALLAACTSTDAEYRDLPVDEWPSQQFVRSLGKGD